MQIAIPKEILKNERRVAATPDTVARLIQLGHQVAVETGAGLGAFFPDEAYTRVGARIVADVRELYRQSDLILKVKGPIRHEQLGQHEVALFREGSLLVTFLHPAAPSNWRMIEQLRDRGLTSFTMDGIPRISRAQTMDALTSMSLITGYKSVLIAANRLPVFMPMTGTAIGTLKPAKVLVVGAGVVGLQALATAKRLGGVCSCVDIRPDAREQARSLGAKVVGMEVPPELALGTGGYARALPSDWLEQERALLAPLVADADVVILSALVPGETAPILLTEAMVRSMRPGSVIVDVSIDQGGNCALSEPGVEKLVGEVQVLGLANIPGSIPVHSTHLYANNLYHFVANLFKKGATPDWEDEIVQSTLVTRGHQIVHAGTLKAMGHG